MNLLVLFLIGVANSVLRTSKEKYRLLLEKTMLQKNGVIQMTENQVKGFLTQHPRNYDLVVMFVTEKCDFCKALQPHFEKVAQAFKNHSMYLPRKKKNEKEIKRPIFFVLVNLLFKTDFLTKRY